jgi:hypothetical protein
MSTYSYNSEFVQKVREAYDEYYLDKVKRTPQSSFAYDTDANRFVEWLEQVSGLIPPDLGIVNTDPSNKPINHPEKE